MRELVSRYLSNAISRRDFLKGLTATGVTITAASQVPEPAGFALIGAGVLALSSSRKRRGITA